MWFSEKFKIDTSIKSILVNFMPSWWYKNYQIEYGEAMVFDPDYRIETDQLMRKKLFERYQSIGLGAENPLQRFILPDWQNALSIAIVGESVRYPKDNYPQAKHLDADQIAKIIVPPNISDVFPFNEIIKQTNYMNVKFGFSMDPVLPTRGILNEAVILGGSDVLADLMEEGNPATHLLNFSYNLFCEVIKENLKVRKSKKDLSILMTNCTAKLIGPKLYREKILAFDIDIINLCTKNNIGIGLHHCGNFDEFLDTYKQLKKIKLLEVGSDSDLKKCIKAAPNAEISYIIDNNAITNYSKIEFKEYLLGKLNPVKQYLNRISINAADLDYYVPDENIAMLYEVCSKL